MKIKNIHPQKSLLQPHTKIGAGAILWLLCLQLFVVKAIVQRAWPVPFNSRINYISDLGAVNCEYHVRRLTLFADAICSPRHDLMNGSFVLQGILMCAGCLLLRRLFSVTRLSVLALTMIFLSGLTMMALGLAPEDVQEHRHTVAAIAHSFLQNAGLIVLGISLLRRLRPFLLWGWTTIASGAAGFLFAALMFFRNHLAPGYLGIGPGGIQQLSLYPFSVWLASSALFILLRCRMLCDESRSDDLLRREDTYGPSPASSIFSPQPRDIPELTFQETERS